jgi:hypothetical protein
LLFILAGSCSDGSKSPSKFKNNIACVHSGQLEERKKNLPFYFELF